MRASHRHFLFKFTDRCHRVETQLQSMNIVSYILRTGSTSECYVTVIVPTVCAVHIVLCVVVFPFFLVILLRLMCVVVASCNWECVPFTVLSIVFRAV